MKRSPGSPSTTPNSPAAEQSGSGAQAAAGCFHCGLPLPDRPFHAEDEGGRSFCCPACVSVYQAVLGAGLEAFYRFRTDAPKVRPDTADAPALTYFDHPDIQTGFVRRTAKGCLRAHLTLEGIHCPACLWLIEQRLRRVPAVESVALDYASESVELDWDPGGVRLSAILGAIEALGYRARPFDASHRRAQAAERKRRSGERLLFAGLAGMPVMHFAWAGYLVGGPTHAPELWELFGRWASLVAVSAILVYSGREFFSGAWRDLRNQRPGMDVPIALGLGAAFGASVLATVAGRGEVYFDTIVMFVFLVLLARRLEARGRWRAAAPLDRLARITPRIARRLKRGGDSEAEVPAVDLVPGDRVRVLPGETVAADAIIERGTSRFDEAVLSGEPRPRSRGPGEAVVGGARNLEQTVVVQVQRRACDSLLGEVQAMLRKGLSERPRAGRMVERVAGGFVLGVLVLAAATGLAWGWLAPERALESTIAVLIVTCPCALALAVPSAYALGTARLAELGIVPARGTALEPLAGARVAVFDKTGTLTQPSLDPAAGWSPDGRIDRYLEIAAALERDAVHPIAAAFSRHVPHTRASVTEHRSIPGRGVEGRLAGQCWRLGDAEFIAEQLPVGSGIRQRLEALKRTHGRAVLLADGRHVRAVFGLTETLREDALETIRTLRRHGIDRVFLLSGDRGPGLERVAARLGADADHGGLSAGEKLAFVRRLQATGERVLAVGDGINDAPVLGAADVSVAVPEATGLARLGSDFVLLGDGIRALAEARVRARFVRRIVRQNLAWAIGYNLVAVPAAVLGLVPPWGAALGMSLSSMLVVGNSLRLSRRRAKEKGARLPLAAPT